MTVFRWLVLAAVVSGLAAAGAMAVFVTRSVSFGVPERVALVAPGSGPGGPTAAFRPSDRFVLSPEPALTAERLAGYRMAMVVQHRPQTYAEAVDLRSWLATGGRALVYTDAESARDGRWRVGGEDEPDLRLVASGGTRPIGFRLAGRVARPGRWSASPPCRIAGDGLIADCPIGRGRIVLVASTRLAPAAVNPFVPSDDRRALAAALLRAMADDTALPADARDPQTRGTAWMAASGMLALVAFVCGICAGFTAARPKRAPVTAGVARTTRSHPPALE